MIHLVRRRVAALTGLAIATALLTAPPAVGAPHDDGHSPHFSWQQFDTGDDQFESLDAVSNQVAWFGTLSGHILRTVDGGVTFTDVSPPEQTEFYAYMDIEAASADEALALAYSFEGPSLIYRTTDGGATWEETFRAQPGSIIACLAMFNPRHGFGVGRLPVGGKFPIVTTDDAGASWHVVPSDGMPEALPGERVYGIGGDCATATGRTAYFAASYGGPDTIARVYRSSDDGLTWQFSSLPPELQEVTSIDFRTDRLGIASDGIGGSGFARTTDGGKTWVSDQSGLKTYEVSWWADRRGHERNPAPEQKTAFIGTTHGWTYFTRNRGKTWQSFDTWIGYSRIDCAERTLACWGAATSEGRIGRLVAD